MFAVPGQRGKMPKFRVDVQTFTANGTWRKPVGALFVTADVCGGGAPGGGGSRALNGTAVTGGKGGGGGLRRRGTFAASVCGLTEAIIVGVQTVASPGSTSNNNAGDTNGGNRSAFGSLLSCRGGWSGQGGGVSPTTDLVLGFTSTSEALATMEGGSAFIGALSDLTARNSIDGWEACGGGHGAPRSTADTGAAGSNGGSPTGADIGHGGAGGATNTAGSTSAVPGAGGGGGGNRSGGDGVGAAGADGTAPGGGGGGGGAGRNGNGGAGGKGARGEVSVYTLCAI